MSHISIALDIVVAALLIATIVYASVLNSKLATLRNTKQEMEALVNSLVDSTDQAQRGLSELKAAAGESGQSLDQRVREARALADDLGFLVDRAGGLADRLETQIGKARAAARIGENGSSEAGEPEAKGRAKTARGRRELAQKSGKNGGKLRAVSAAAAVEDGEADQAEAPERRPAAGAPAGAPAGAGSGANGTDEAAPPANAKLLRALRGLR